ncbi:hypothetical protein BBP40_003354 [Aspergillus hancockii]|nr:hypothetical protein BBP40_003354 [Aspergillus hancockii]
MPKPGGYIQRDDVNCSDSSTIKTDAGMATLVFDRLRRFGYFNNRHGWALESQEILKENRFVDALSEYFRDWTELVLADEEQDWMTMKALVGSLW